MQGYDRFAYANNNPVIYIDPTGRAVCLLEPEECDYLQNLNSGGGGGISNGTLSKDYAARFYRSFLKDRYDWGVADDFTENELKVMRRTAQDIETYVDGLTGGMGQEWMNEYMGGINIGTRVILFLARHLHRTQVQVSNPLKNTEIATPPKYKSGGSQRHRGKLIIYWLLDRLKSIGNSIRYACFDKGFCSVPVLKTLQRRKIRFIIPIPVRGKSGGMRTLFESASHKTTYTFNSPKHGQLEVAAVAVRKYSKGRYKRKGARWFAYAVGRLPKSVEAHQVFEMYRQRFGIESSYRQMNQTRARTTS